MTKVNINEYNDKNFTLFDDNSSYNTREKKVQSVFFRCLSKVSNFLFFKSSDDDLTHRKVEQFSFPKEHEDAEVIDFIDRAHPGYAKLEDDSIAKEVDEELLKNQKTFLRFWNRVVCLDYTIDGFIRNGGDLRKWDPEVVARGLECYLSSILAYRFTGQNMVGTCINIPNPQSGDVVEYRIDKVFVNAEGLVGYGMVPVEDREAPTRILFRGTHVSRMVVHEGRAVTGVEADLNAEIGREAYELSKKEIIEWLKQQKTSAIVSGHSLGGCIAMRAVFDSENNGKIFRLLTYNSPGIERDAIDSFKGKLPKLDCCVIGGDAVSMIGNLPKKSVVHVYKGSGDMLEKHNDKNPYLFVYGKDLKTKTMNGLFFCEMWKTSKIGKILLTKIAQKILNTGLVRNIVLSQVDKLTQS